MITVPDYLVSLFESTSFAPQIPLIDGDVVHWSTIAALPAGRLTSQLRYTFHQRMGDETDEHDHHPCVSIPTADAEFLVAIVAWLALIMASRTAFSRSGPNLLTGRSS